MFIVRFTFRRLSSGLRHTWGIMQMDWKHNVVHDIGTPRGHSVERLEDFEVSSSRGVRAPRASVQRKNLWREGRIGVMESAGIGASASIEGAMAAARHRSKRMIQESGARGVRKMRRSETSTSFWTESA